MKRISICLFILLVVVAAALPARPGAEAGKIAIGTGFPVMIPVGDFRDMIILAFGSSLEAGSTGLIGPLDLRLKVGYYYCSSTCNITTSYQALSAALYCGYPLSLHRRISLTPLVGLGVLYHLEGDIFYPDPEGYADMFITAGTGLELFVLEDLSLNAVPEYTVFFEQGYCGMFFNFDLGVRYHF
jgi:hypothetical protein